MCERIQSHCGADHHKNTIAPIYFFGSSNYKDARCEKIYNNDKFWTSFVKQTKNVLDICLCPLSNQQKKILDDTMTLTRKPPFVLMKYNGMERNKMKYNNLLLFGFEK
jgi:hypothetical protein